jgi:membrane protein
MDPFDKMTPPVFPTFETFSQTTVGVTGGKLTFGLVFAIWSASVGFSAIQDSLNVIYKVKETRSYLAARFSAVGVTIILMVTVTLMLTTMLDTDLFARMVYLRIYHFFAAMIAFTVRGVSWLFVTILRGGLLLRARCEDKPLAYARARETRKTPN